MKQDQLDPCCNAFRAYLDDLYATSKEIQQIQKSYNELKKEKKLNFTTLKSIKERLQKLEQHFKNDEAILIDLNHIGRCIDASEEEDTNSNSKEVINI